MACVGDTTSNGICLLKRQENDHLLPKGWEQPLEGFLGNQKMTQGILGFLTDVDGKY